MLTQEQVKELLSYNGEVLRWRRSRGNSKRAGSIAGGLSVRGYWQVKVLGKSYLAHRLIWLYTYGYFPENGLDHINRDKIDNRLSNLREVSRQCNARNTGNISSNTSGVKGVYFDKEKDAWMAIVRVSGKAIKLGTTKDFVEAVALRLAGEQALDWAGCDASSPAYQFIQKEVNLSTT